MKESKPKRESSEDALQGGKGELTKGKTDLSLLPLIKFNCKTPQT
jgi:hypothetical protein